MRAPAAALLLALTPATLCAQPVPWLRLESAALSDNQPRQALHASLEYGRWLSPAVTGSIVLLADHVTGADVAASTTYQPGLRGSVGISRARTGIRAGASALLGAGRTTALGFVDVSTTVAGQTALRARAHRVRYASTVASLDTIVLEHRVELAIDRAAAPGWAGEAVARRDDYRDDNPVTTLYGWVLAPLSRSMAHSLRVGVSSSRQDSEHSRWVPDDAARRGRGSTADSIPGRYDPYHTPHDAVTHSIIADAALLLGSTWLRADAGYGFHASDLAPTLQRTSQSPNAQPVLLFYEREFSPWSARVSSHTPLGDASLLSATLHVSRTAFYREAGARLVLARSLR